MRDTRFLSRALSRVLDKIARSLTTTHVSSVHCSSSLSYLLAVCDKANSARTGKTPASASASGPISAKLLAQMQPVLKRFRGVVDVARRRHLGTLEEHAAVLSTALENTVPPPMSTQVSCEPFSNPSGGGILIPCLCG